MKTIKLTWKTKKVKNSARVNQMYCFKSCGKNQNQYLWRIQDNSTAVCRAICYFRRKYGIDI